MQKTLKVKNILVSQPKPESEKSPYFDMQKKYGVNIDFHQLIRIEELTPREFRAQHINILDYSAIIFNSRHGVDHFFNLCKEMRIVMPDTQHYYCISESIANYLQKYIQYRKRKVFFGPHNKMEELIPMMKRRPTDKFLMVMSDIHNDDIIEMFAKHKITVTPAVFYRTVANKFKREEKKDYDMYVLFTPSGVSALLDNYPHFKQEERIIACFGAGTAQALRDAGLRVDIETPSPEFQSITSAIDAFLKENHKRVR